MIGNIRILFVGMVAFAAALNSACKTGANSSSGERQQPPVQSTHATPVGPRLVCPALGTILVPAPQSRDGHRVTLKWKPSRHGDPKHAEAVGYCIYRGPKPNAPPTELVNQFPFPETQCVDDSVENGKQYYYVVRAISARGATSDVSKPPVPAKIPAAPPVGFQRRDASIPQCRESPAVKGP